MRKHILTRKERSRQFLPLRFEPVMLNPPSIVRALSKDGFAVLPGLAYWFNRLNPLKNPEAWKSFSDNDLLDTLRAHPFQQRRFFLSDEGKLDDEPQLGVNFVAKEHKSHVTILEGSDPVADDPGLSKALQKYLKDIFEFIHFVRETFCDILPPIRLPTILKVRIFHYRAAKVVEAMRAHVDGSIATVILAESDGQLCLSHNGRWQSAIRLGQKPFALAIPGIAAIRLLKVLPTPHRVLGNQCERVSVTVFLTPALCGNRVIALQQLKRWKLTKSFDQFSFSE